MNIQQIFFGLILNTSLIVHAMHMRPIKLPPRFNHVRCMQMAHSNLAKDVATEKYLMGLRETIRNKRVQLLTCLVGTARLRNVLDPARSATTLQAQKTELRKLISQYTTHEYTQRLSKAHREHIENLLPDIPVCVEDAKYMPQGYLEFLDNINEIVKEFKVCGPQNKLNSCESFNRYKTWFKDFN